MSQHHQMHRVMKSSSSPISNKKRVHWTLEEHRLFLCGLKIYERGDWKSISRYMASNSAYKTPNQIASHAQKYFLRQQLKNKNRKSICDTTENDLAFIPRHTDRVPPLNEIHSLQVEMPQELQQLQQIIHSADGTNKLSQPMDKRELCDNMNTQPNGELNWKPSPLSGNMNPSPQNCIDPPNVGMQQESKQSQQVFLSNPISSFPQQQMDGHDETIEVIDHDDNHLLHPQNMDILPPDDWIHVPNVKAQQLLKSQQALKECYRDQPPNNSPQETYVCEIQPLTEVVVASSQQGQQLSFMKVFNHIPQLTDYSNNLDWTHPIEAKLQQLQELSKYYYLSYTCSF